MNSKAEGLAPHCCCKTCRALKVCIGSANKEVSEMKTRLESTVPEITCISLSMCGCAPIAWNTYSTYTNKHAEATATAGQDFVMEMLRR